MPTRQGFKRQSEDGHAIGAVMVNYIVHIRQRDKHAGTPLRGMVEIPQKRLLLEFEGFAELAAILARNGMGAAPSRNATQKFESTTP